MSLDYADVFHALLPQNMRVLENIQKISWVPARLLFIPVLVCLGYYNK